MVWPLHGTFLPPYAIGSRAFVFFIFVQLPCWHAAVKSLYHYRHGVSSILAPSITDASVAAFHSMGATD
eukprot:1134265-Pelagomonas_calceolata.AAC.3